MALQPRDWVSVNDIPEFIKEYLYSFGLPAIGIRPNHVIERMDNRVFSSTIHSVFSVRECLVYKLFDATLRAVVL
jgi:hypothetical protein